MFKKLSAWLRGKLLGEKYAEAVELLQRYRWTVEGLNESLGNLHRCHQQERQEKMVYLGAIAMQSGGSFELPKAFLDTVMGGNYLLSIRPKEDGSAVVISVSEAEAAAAGPDASAQAAQPHSPPFTPAHAALGDFEEDGPGGDCGAGCPCGH